MEVIIMARDTWKVNDIDAGKSLCADLKASDEKIIKPIHSALMAAAADVAAIDRTLTLNEQMHDSLVEIAAGVSKMAPALVHIGECGEGIVRSAEQFQEAAKAGALGRV